MNNIIKMLIQFNDNFFQFGLTSLFLEGDNEDLS
jgi:hypothetical protein